ncbi:LPD7 domain-containing protein [Propionivibrio sp.]|uniref:LPD7 domain-containing protein n=1 Tax=Propionivibrio sp. TaxID=2212460 RepID=UPI0039E552D8
MKTSTLLDDPEFAATARAYGGAKGYAQAQVTGRTKLTYQQWVQVRTPVFKAWFGDWEGGNARIQPVTLDLAGWSGSASELSALAREVYTKELQGTTIDNASLGAPVAFSAEGKGEAFGARGKLRNPARAELVRVLREVVGGAVAVAQEAPKKGREVDTRAFHTLVAPLSVNGQTHAVKVTVREALKVPPGDAAHKFYDVTSIQINRSPDVHGLDGTEAPAHPAPVEASVVMVADLARAFNLNVHVDPASVSKVTDPATGEPLVLYRGTEATFAAFSREHPRDDVPFPPGLFFTRTPPSSDAAPPVFLNAKTPNGAIDHVHDGDAWLVFDPAQVQNAVGNPHSLDQDELTIVLANLSAGDQTMANPIQNESAVYGGIPPAEPGSGLVHDTPLDSSGEPETREPWRLENGVVDDVLYYAEGQEKYDEAIRDGNHALADDISGYYNLAHQKELSGFTLESYARDYDEAHRLNAAMDPARFSEEKPATPKRTKKTTAGAQSSPASKATKPKRASSAKAKGDAASKPQATAPQETVTPAPVPSPAPPPADVAALDPHAQQRLDRVSSNRAADLADAQKKLNADAANRARIHLLQDPIGRHIVAIDRGGVTKAYAVDENPGIAAKTVNTLRDGIRKIGDLAGEINFLPDVIKTRFRLKSGEEKIAYNVDPEGVDPRHSQMREAGLGENDRRNLVVIPEGNPDEISRHVLPSSHLPDDVRKRFVYSDTVPGQYFDRNRKLAFIDKGGRLATDQNAPEIIASMVSVAQAKGWKAITVKGHEDFRREAWLAASLAGLEVKGFKPSDPDLAKLEYERQLRLGNAIQPALPPPATVVNEMVGTFPEAPPPVIGAEAVALGEVARLKGVREDQIPNFMKTAQAFIDEAKRVGIDLPALKVFDPAAPATPTIATPDKAKEPARGIDLPHPDKAPKR